MPIEGSDELKQTNEIGMFIPVIDTLADIDGKTFTGDALLTQRKLAHYLACGQAHYVFTAKDNQLTLAQDLRLAFENRQAPDYSEPYTLMHGRIESRSIWPSTLLNDYLDFPCVGQIFAIHRHTIAKKSGEENYDMAYGLTSHSPMSANAEQVLKFNRGHWSVESHHYRRDWNWNEDRCTISQGHGPENITCLRRFAIGLIKSLSPALTFIEHKILNIMLKPIFRHYKVIFGTFFNPFDSII